MTVRTSDVLSSKAYNAGTVVSFSCELFTVCLTHVYQCICGEGWFVLAMLGYHGDNGQQQVRLKHSTTVRLVCCNYR